MELCLLKLGSRPAFPEAVRHQCICQSHFTPTDASYVPFENPTKGDCKSCPKRIHLGLFNCNYRSALLAPEPFHQTPCFPGTAMICIPDVRVVKLILRIGNWKVKLLKGKNAMNQFSQWSNTKASSNLGTACLFLIKPLLPLLFHTQIPADDGTVFVSQKGHSVTSSHNQAQTESLHVSSAGADGPF